jgi:hypothetical protein
LKLLNLTAAFLSQARQLGDIWPELFRANFRPSDFYAVSLDPPG